MALFASTELQNETDSKYRVKALYSMKFNRVHSYIGQCVCIYGNLCILYNYID